MSENKEHDRTIEELSQGSEQKAHEQAAAGTERAAEQSTGQTKTGPILVVDQRSTNKAAGGALDVNRIVELLKNPLASLKLDGNAHLIYGLLGIAASLVGYLLMILAVGQKIMSIPFLGLFFNGGSLFGKMALLAIISNAALLGSIWLIGLWKGKKRLDIKGLITHFGALQYGAGVLFLAAALVSWMSFGLMMMLLVTGLFIVLILSVVAALEVYSVEKESYSLFIMLVTSAYSVITLALTNILI